MIQPLSNFYCDVLKEVGNIGAGNAATALAGLLGGQVRMNVPSVMWLPFDSVPKRLGGPEATVAGILLDVGSSAPATILVAFPWEQACRLLEVLFGSEATGANSAVLDELAASALQEVGNILAGSYLTSLGNFTGLDFIPGVPALSIDMAGAVLDYVLAEFGQIADQVLLIETEFEVQGKNIQNYFFLVPKPGALEAIFSSLGVGAE